MRLLSFIVRHARKTIVLALLGGAISGCANIVLLGLINRALRQEGPAPKFLMLAFIGICIVLPITRFFSESLLARFGQGALFDLRMKLCRQVLETPLRHLEELGSHRLVGAFTDDLNAVTNALLMIPIICINVVVVICALIYMGWLSWTILLVVIGFMCVGIITYRLPLMKAQFYMRLAREEADVLLNHLRALTDGIKELKLHRQRREAFVGEVFKSAAENFRRQSVSGLTVYIAAASWGQTLGFVVIGLVLFALPALREINLQTLTGYSIALLFIMSPMQLIINSSPAIGRASLALKKLEELRLSLAAQPAETAPIAPLVPRPSPERLELIDITHTYHREMEDRSFTLGPINMTLHAGEMVFLVGGNGSGKTTLAKLLTGLYVPATGEIRLNNDCITSQTRESYRQYFSVVFSDFYLFESLLGLVAPELDACALDYLIQFQLSNKVEVRDGVLSTTNLSQGQRKRLALLTAYLEDRPIYVFDEWAADQDPYFKDIFYLKLLPDLKAKGKTVFVISHDDRYFHLADRLIKLENGMIVEQTSYEKISAHTDQNLCAV